MISIYVVIFLTLLAALLASFAQLLFKKGVPNKLEGVRHVLPLLKNHDVLKGIGANLAAFAVYLYALSAAPLSFVYPTFASSFVFTGLLAHYGFKEELSKLRIFGMTIILVGILIVSFTL